jgi:hypothetical protein
MDVVDGVSNGVICAYLHILKLLKDQNALITKKIYYFDFLSKILSFLNYQFH